MSPTAIDNDCLIALVPLPDPRSGLTDPSSRIMRPEPRQKSKSRVYFTIKDRPSVYNLPDKPVKPAKGMGGRYLASLATGLALTALSALVFSNGGRK